MLKSGNEQKSSKKLNRKHFLLSKFFPRKSAKVNSEKKAKEKEKEKEQDNDIWTKRLATTSMLEQPPSSQERQRKDKVARGDKFERMKLKKDTLIDNGSNRYRVVHLLGAGGFGDVYKVRQEGTSKEFAMKTEMNGIDNPDFMRLSIELEVLTACSAVKDPGRRLRFVPLIDKGKVKQFKYIIMGLVALSLDDLRRKCTSGNFSPSTALQATMQTMQSIWDLHDIGFIHRDIKPGNFACGIGNYQSLIYILDFGISRRFRQRPSGETKDRFWCKFIGTVRFASRNCHSNMEQSRKDDLESWIYMAVELFDLSALPWRNITTDRQRVKQLKCQFFQLTCPPRVFAAFPSEFSRIIQYVDKLQYSDGELKRIAVERKINVALPLDWAGKLTDKLLASRASPVEPTPLAIRPQKTQVDIEETSDEDEDPFANKLDEQSTNAVGAAFRKARIESIARPRAYMMTVALVLINANRETH
ncbi:unnamed protein product, partial [Mesorhabditis spiculigera]